MELQLAALAISEMEEKSKRESLEEEATIEETHFAAAKNKIK